MIEIKQDTVYTEITAKEKNMTKLISSHGKHFLFVSNPRKLAEFIEECSMLLMNKKQ
jgi:hypothetical protein